MFFVASAPRSEAGRVNLSPKGYESFAVLSPTQVRAHCSRSPEIYMPMVAKARTSSSLAAMGP